MIGKRFFPVFFSWLRLYVRRTTNYSLIFPTIISGAIQLPEDISCKFYDIAGRQVDVVQLTPGIYFIEINEKLKQKVIKFR